ncbi:hypothetical protein D3C84_1035360 [compost metagenome]
MTVERYMMNFGMLHHMLRDLTCTFEENVTYLLALILGELVIEPVVAPSDSPCHPEGGLIVIVTACRASDVPCTDVEQPSLGAI